MQLVAAFEELLKRTTGLDASSIGSAMVARAVKARMSACDLKEPHAYLERIQTSPAELQELVEAVVIPETWFFRDREAFEAMARVTSEGGLRGQAKGALQLLSLPCSTGEEPYSMAMALLDAGLTADRFRIDAVDISARALARAERAVFGKNSFRGSQLGFRDRHFESTPQGYRLYEAVRRSVHFQQGNLFDPGMLTGVGVYDIIFCRNILIYFDAGTQERAIGRMTRLLTASGLLFVGPSEAGLLFDHAFISAKIPRAFAFRKASTRPQPMRREAAHPVKQIGASSSGGLPPRPAPAPAEPRIAPPAQSASGRRLTIGEIRGIADQGKLVEAAHYCEEYLRDGDQPAEALHLLGLIRDAAGNHEEAAAYYRKTLYLEPNHYEALVHLALLLERRGDKAGAKVLNERVGRLDRPERKQHA